MLLAIAALVIHIRAVPQNSIPIAPTAAADLGSSVTVYLAPAKPRYERPSQRLWLTLSVAQYGAATFDAWSTRRAISSGQGQEQNLLLKPFAGNASLYAAIQVGPTLLDYLGRQMMRSQQVWARHAWWLPQALGTALSLASAAHNLGVASVFPESPLPGRLADTCPSRPATLSSQSECRVPCIFYD
jgi:hypothetical protein